MEPSHRRTEAPAGPHPAGAWPPHAVASAAGRSPRGRARPAGLDEASGESFPASDPIAIDHDRDDDAPAAPCGCGQTPRVAVGPGVGGPDDGTRAAVDHGHVVIAAITSCTNTSNPSVMIGAGAAGQEGRRARA